jgi:hypothetical protein
MTYAVEMGSGAMMYISNFIQIVSGIETYTDTQTDWRSHRPT